MPKQTSQSDNKKRAVIAAVFLMLLLVATGAWAMWNREDPQVVAIRELVADFENIPENQRREHFGKVREAMDALPEEKRDQVRDEMRQGWEERESNRLKDFFNMSAQEQIAELDRQIDRMEKWRKERAQRDKDGGDRRNRGRRGSRAQSFGVGSNGSVGASDRDRSRLDRSNPESRAYRDQFRRMMAQRMQQRGIQAPSWGRRGPRG
jgi:hypothetical protein